MLSICVTFFTIEIMWRSAGMSLQPAHPLYLADLPLESAGQAFDFAFDSHRPVRKDFASHCLGRTSYDTKQTSCLIACAEFHGGLLPSEFLPYSYVTVYHILDRESTFPCGNGGGMRSGIAPYPF